MPGLRRAIETEARRLLRLLLLREREMSTNPTQRYFVLCLEVIAYNQPLHHDALTRAGERRRYAAGRSHIDTRHVTYYS